MGFLRKCHSIIRLNSRSLKTKVSIIDGQNVRIRSEQPWISTIGLEVHAQLQTRTKLFSRSAAGSQSPVNSQVSLFDLSTPGTLPVINKKAVELALKSSLALNCKINKVSSFDRKHYFYADLPTGYQITQQSQPIAYDGYLDYLVLKSPTVPSTYTSRSKIIQLQLEQDSGKTRYYNTERRKLKFKMARG
jgi:aspartyl-tRNA(Asn)/glutamyl-tRNA(Gln) amidotransferase subunit B